MAKIDVVCTLDTLDEKNGEIDLKSPQIEACSPPIWDDRVYLKVGSEEHIVLGHDIIDAVKRALSSRWF